MQDDSLQIITHVLIPAGMRLLPAFLLLIYAFLVPTFVYYIIMYLRKKPVSEKNITGIKIIYSVFMVIFTIIFLLHDGIDGLSVSGSIDVVLSCAIMLFIIIYIPLDIFLKIMRRTLKKDGLYIDDKPAPKKISDII